MAEESEFETNQPQAERRYQERLDYENMLKMQVMNVTNALTTGRDGMDATEVLLVMLIPELMEPIRAEVEEAENILHGQIKNIVEKYEMQKNYYGAGRDEPEMIRKAYFRDDEVRRINGMKAYHRRKYAMKVLKLVIDVLNDSGMLLSQERRLDEGGY